MRRATGPATVEPIPTPAGVPFPGGAAVLLSNFDFDDATVKAAHEKWLREQALPRLQRGAKLFLRGTASKVGNRDYNLKLSERRADAVRDFLLKNGVPAGQIVTTFTGEDQSTSLNPDDPRDRAVQVVFDFPPITNANFQQSARGDTLDGFDDGVSPPAQVVPLERLQGVRLLGGRGALLESTNELVVRVQDARTGNPGRVIASVTDFFFELQPVLEGKTIVTARDVAGRIVARLAVVVLANKEVTVAFHYMQGAIATTRTPDESKEKGFIGVMNRIYNRQANITFTRKGNDTPTEPKVVGPEVRTDLATLGGDWPKIVAHRNGARFNIFFVKVLELDANAATDSVDAVTQIGGKRDCIFEDPDANDPGDTNDGETFAHEAGHAFGERDDTDNANLMFGTTHQRGRLIPAAAAARMNANLRTP